MEIKWIEDFVALAQTQSFSRAAEMRNVTQSGFSRRIQALEQWVGADLVDRSSYPPSLTPAGRLFREAATEILAQLYDTRAIIRDERRRPGVGLQIAAGHTIALNFLPGWLASLPTQFRDVRTRVVPTNVHDSVLMLANGNCELMFAYHHPELPLHLDPSRYDYRKVGVDVLLPVCRGDAQGKPVFRISRSASRPVPIISYSETSYFGRCLEYLLKQGEGELNVRRHHESDMAELQKKMTLAGEGVAWLPRSAVADEIARAELVPAFGPRWSLQLELRVYRDTTVPNPLVTSLWSRMGADTTR